MDLSLLGFCCSFVCFVLMMDSRPLEESSLVIRSDDCSENIADSVSRAGSHRHSVRIDEVTSRKTLLHALFALK